MAKGVKECFLPRLIRSPPSGVPRSVCLLPSPPLAQAKLQGLVRSKSSLDLPTGWEMLRGQQVQGHSRAIPLSAASGILSSGQTVAVSERRSSGSSSSPLGRPSAPRHHPPRLQSSEKAGGGLMMVAARAASPHGVSAGRPGDRAAAAEPLLTLSDMAQIYAGGGDSEAGPGEGLQGQPGLLGSDAEEEGEGPGIDPDLLRALKAAGPGFLVAAAAAPAAMNPALLEAFGSVIGSGSHGKAGGIMSSGCSQVVGQLVGQQVGQVVGQQERRASSRLSLQEPAALPMKLSPHSGGAQQIQPLAVAAAAPLSLLSPGRSQPRPHSHHTSSHQARQQRGHNDGLLMAAGTSGRESRGHRPEQLLHLLSEPPDLVCSISLPPLFTSLAKRDSCVRRLTASAPVLKQPSVLAAPPLPTVPVHLAFLTSSLLPLCAALSCTLPGGRVAVRLLCAARRL